VSIPKSQNSSLDLGFTYRALRLGKQWAAEKTEATDRT
jgi:hypothetical protein